MRTQEEKMTGDDHVESSDFEELSERTQAFSGGSMSPISMSPVKSSRGSSPLPPITSDSLNISKRRRLDPSSSSPIEPRYGNETNLKDPYSTPRVFPEKSRSMSSPVRRMSTSRTPSLTDCPIPVLSPPPPPPVQRNSSEISKNRSGRRCISLMMPEIDVSIGGMINGKSEVGSGREGDNSTEHILSQQSPKQDPQVVLPPARLPDIQPEHEPNNNKSERESDNKLEYEANSKPEPGNKPENEQGNGVSEKLAREQPNNEQLQLEIGEKDP